MGDLIDFYNIQFYNQLDHSPYDTYETLFLYSRSDHKFGSSVRELMYKGIPSKKIVIGKPATKKNLYNTGYMNPKDLNKALMKGYATFNWFGGVMIWEYYSDQEGRIIEEAIGGLDITCGILQNCH